MMTDEPDFNSLQSPEIARSVAESIRLGIARIQVEKQLSRDPIIDFESIAPDVDTIESYVRGFHILLQLLTSNEATEATLDATIADLSALCDQLEDHEAQEVAKVISHLEG